ncbi:MAG: hypothetical protein WC365_08660 [Candidatus Babeliales bacterium]|jgi:hypothetical protein
MENFERIAIKSTCDVYTLKMPDDKRFRCMWAKIIIDESAWMFSCISDAGNFSHRWPYESHRTFKKFLTEIDMGYLMRKIEPHGEEFDYEATIKNIKEHLFESRRNGDIDKKEARKAYKIVEHLDYENSEDLVLYQLIEGHKYFSDDYCWTADLIIKNHSPEAITFTEIIFPMLQEALKIELNFHKQDYAKKGEG